MKIDPKLRLPYHGKSMIEVDGKQYYSAEEACSVLGVKLPTLYSYVNRGLVTSYRQAIRRQRLYSRDEIDALLVVTPAGREEAVEEIPLAETWNVEH